MISVKGFPSLNKTKINNGDVLITTNGAVYFVVQTGYGKCQLFGESFNRLADRGTFERETNLSIVEDLNFIKVAEVIKAGQYDIIIQSKENN